MAAPDSSRSIRWGSFVAMVIFFAIAIAVLALIPSSPANRSHTTVTLTPGSVSLPPTAPASVAPTAPVTDTATATP